MLYVCISFSSLLLSMHVCFVLFPLFDLSSRFSFSTLILLVGSFDTCASFLLELFLC